MLVHLRDFQLGSGSRDAVLEGGMEARLLSVRPHIPSVSTETLLSFERFTVKII